MRSVYSMRFIYSDKNDRRPSLGYTHGRREYKRNIDTHSASVPRKIQRGFRSPWYLDYLLSKVSTLMLIFYLVDKAEEREKTSKLQVSQVPRWLICYDNDGYNAISFMFQNNFQLLFLLNSYQRLKKKKSRHTWAPKETYHWKAFRYTNLYCLW